MKSFKIFSILLFKIVNKSQLEFQTLKPRGWFIYSFSPLLTSDIQLRIPDLKIFCNLKFNNFIFE